MRGCSMRSPHAARRGRESAGTACPRIRNGARPAAAPRGAHPASARAARDVFARELGADANELAVVYDVAHNIAKVEEHVVDGVVRRLIVHRKGATRAFPGQPVIVPGDMGRYSYLLVGTEAAMRETFGSTCHGAGRVLSRSAAVRAARGRRVDLELRERGVVARATGKDALAEEMPEAYKDVREVVDVVHRFGISLRVARLRPLGVIKG